MSLDLNPIEGYEDAVKDFMTHVVWNMWRRLRGGSATYWHALGHIVEKCSDNSEVPIKRRPVGLSSLTNDQVIEHTHQLVREELVNSKSGKGKDDYTAEDMNKPYLYPSKLKTAMATLNKKALAECTAKEVEPATLELLECTLTDEKLKAIWK